MKGCLPNLKSGGIKMTLKKYQEWVDENELKRWVYEQVSLNIALEVELYSREEEDSGKRNRVYA